MTGHFFGTIKGRSATAANREGTKSSGLRAQLASAAGYVTIELTRKNGEDWLLVYLFPSKPKAEDCLIYRGPLSEYKPEQQPKEKTP